MNGKGNDNYDNYGNYGMNGENGGLRIRRRTFRQALLRGFQEHAKVLWTTSERVGKDPSWFFKRLGCPETNGVLAQVILPVEQRSLWWGTVLHGTCSHYEEDDLI